MSLILLGILNSQVSGAAQAFWLATIGGSSDEYIYASATDSANAFYSAGYTDTATGTGQDFCVIKQDSNGDILWQKRYGASNGQVARSIAVDSSDNVLIMGDQGTKIILVKVNSSGTIQWQRGLEDGFYGVGFGATAADSSDNIYVVGAYGGTRAFIVKYNSSGTLQWQKYLGTGTNTNFKSVAIDSSGNAYAVGATNTTGSGSYDFLISKWNSSGTLQWQRLLGQSAYEQSFQVRIDSANNVYVVGTTTSQGLGSNEALIAKYNTSGTLQWQRILGGSFIDQWYGLAFDSSDNIYLGGQTTSDGAGNTDYLVAKYDSSGTIQWQRTIGTTGQEYGYGISVDDFDSVYVTGSTNAMGVSGSEAFIAKIPSDGSLTGTYVLDGVNVDYEASTLTAATSTLIISTPSLSDGTSTLTTPTISLTAANTSFTKYQVDL